MPVRHDAAARFCAALACGASLLVSYAALTYVVSVIAFGGSAAPLRLFAPSLETALSLASMGVLAAICLRLALPSRLVALLRRIPRVCATLTLLGACLLVAELGLQVAGMLARFGARAATETAAAGETVILCIGDSFTFGMGASSRAASWPAQLEQQLAAAVPDASPRVVNAGMPGSNSAQALDRLAELLPVLKPAIVLVCCGANNRWNFAAGRRDDGSPPRDRGQAWREQWTRLLLHVRLYRLAALGGVRLDRDELPRLLPPDQARLRALCRLGLTPHAAEWLGETALREVIAALQAEPDVAIRCWALGALLGGATAESVFPPHAWDTALEVQRALEGGRLSAARRQLWASSGLEGPEDRALLAAWAGPTPSEEIVALWAADHNHPLLTLWAWCAIAPADASRAEHIAARGLFNAADPAVDFLQQLRLLLDTPALAARQAVVDPHGRGARYAAWIARCPDTVQAQRDLLAQWTASDPDWAWAWRELGIRRARLHDAAGAVAALETATTLLSHDPVAWRWKAICRAQLGDRAAALDALERALIAGLDGGNARALAATIFDGSWERAYSWLVHRQALRPRWAADDGAADLWARGVADHLTRLEHHLDAMRALCDAAGARMFTHSYPHDTEVSRFLDRYGAARGTALVSHRERFAALLKSEDARRWFVADGHCNDAGYRLMAETLAPALVPLLRAARPTPPQASASETEEKR